MLLANPGIFNIPLAEKVLDFITETKCHYQPDPHLCIIGIAAHMHGGVGSCNFERGGAGLRLRPSEAAELYFEMDNATAIAILQDYIDQARAHRALVDAQAIIRAAEGQLRGRRRRQGLLAQSGVLR